MTQVLKARDRTEANGTGRIPEFLRLNRKIGQAGRRVQRMKRRWGMVSQHTTRHREDLRKAARSAVSALDGMVTAGEVGMRD
eukprot:15455077-Alexandrium_andersonii.AAC.1